MPRSERYESRGLPRASVSESRAVPLRPLSRLPWWAASSSVDP